MTPDPAQLTDAERQWNDVLRFENHEIYTRMSRDFGKVFDPNPPTPEEVAEAFRFKYG